jgi:hypothetical protein
MSTLETDGLVKRFAQMRRSRALASAGGREP